MNKVDYIPTREEFNAYCDYKGWFLYREEVWLEMFRAHFLTRKGEKPKSWQALASSYNGVVVNRHRKLPKV